MQRGHNDTSLTLRDEPVYDTNLTSTHFVGNQIDTNVPDYDESVNRATNLQ